MKEKIIILWIPAIFFAGAANAGTQVDPESAMNMLNRQNRQFEQQVIQITENVYTAIGFHGANTSMIIGGDGIIIIDTLMGPESARNPGYCLQRALARQKLSQSSDTGKASPKSTTCQWRCPHIR